MAIVTTTHSPATLAAALYLWKEDLKAQGWTVPMSSDGTANYSFVADVITSGGTGANGFNNDNAWMRLVSPDGVYEMILISGGTLGDVFTWLFSTDSVPFSDVVSGPANLTTPPLTTDLNYQVYAAFQSPSSGLPAGPFSMTIGVDDAAPYGTWFTFDSGSTPIFGAAFSPVVTTGNPAIAYFQDPSSVIFTHGSAPDGVAGWATITDSIGVSGGGPTDTTAPTISAFTPASGSSILRTASIAVDVADETALLSVEIWGTLADGSTLLVYDGSAFVGIFATSSTLSTGTYTVIPDAPGWPSSTVALKVRATDTSGNQTNATGSFTISNVPAAPTIGPFSPTDGGTTTRAGTVTIDVTDDEGRTAIAQVKIDVTIASGQVITAYNGAAFPGPLTAGSARSDITNGYRYSLVYGGAGWPSSTLAYRVTAVDAQGRITTDTSYNLTITDPPAAPVIGGWTPSAGAVSRLDNVDFTVTSPDNFASIVVWAVLTDGTTVVVYDGAAFGAQVNAASTVGGTTTRSFSVTYDGDGWVAGYALHVRATDTLGQTATATQEYTLTDAPAPVAPDVTPPQISELTPADTANLSRNQAVRFNVTDDILLRRVFVFVNMGTTDEVIWNGYAFTAKYAGGSTITEVEGGFAFVVLRSGGWMSSPSFTIHPFDTSGNEA